MFHIPKISRKWRDVMANTRAGIQWFGNGLQIRNTQDAHREGTLNGECSGKCEKWLRKSRSIESVKYSSPERSCVWNEPSTKTDLLESQWLWRAWTVAGAELIMIYLGLHCPCPPLSDLRPLCYHRKRFGAHQRAQESTWQQQTL